MVSSASAQNGELNRTRQELQHSEERYRLLFLSTLNATAFHEIITNGEGVPIDYRFLDVNPAFERLTGLQAVNVIGKTAREVIPGIENDPADWIGKYGQVALLGEEVHFEQYSQALGRWFRCVAFRPRERQFYVVFEDITEIKAEEGKRIKENRIMAVANGILKVFVEKSGHKMYGVALEIILDALCSKYGVFGYIDEQGELYCPSLSKVFDECEMKDKCIHYPLAEWKGLWSRALLEKRSYFTNDPPAVPPGHVPIDNNLAVPIIYQGQIIGLFNLANKEDGYNEEDKEFLEAVAGKIAPVLNTWIQNEMRETERRRAEKALRKERKLLQTIFDNIPIMLTTYDTADMKILVNKHFRLVSGWSQEEMQAPDAMEKVYPRPEYRQQVIEYMRSLVPGFMDIQLTCKDGTTKETSWSNIMINDGRQVGIGIDISERKAMELELRRQTEQLAATNSELESFSFSVSHDLRAPLRAIVGFSSLLRSRAGQLDDKAIEYLQRITAGAEKMNVLIDDMLRLSRISRQEMVMQEIDLGSMANAVINDLEQLYPERHVEMHIANGLKARGDAQLVKIALTNLFSNAWKYTGKTNGAQVEFGSCRKKGKKVFFIRDNGSGFPMNQTGRLFQPFQRLHSESDYEGNGIGLPIVQRVINRHGGNIWAEGEVNRGAVFYFTLGS